MKFALALLAALIVPGTSSAAVVAYTDRAAFESALGSFTVDSLNGIPQRGTSVVNRPDYSATGGFFGCVNHVGCAPATPGFDDAYLWSYQQQQNFDFSTSMFGFGFDYNGDPLQAPSGAQPIIAGLVSGTTSGFFGVISDVAFNLWQVEQTSSFMLIDNITYGSSLASTTSVPVPAALPLLTAGLGILGFFGWRRKQSAV